MPTEIINLLTGAGGSAVLMWMWLSSEKKEKGELKGDLAEATKREREMTQKVVEALLLNKEFLERHRGEFEKFGETVENELSKIADTLKETLNPPES